MGLQCCAGTQFQAPALSAEGRGSSGRGHHKVCHPAAGPSELTAPCPPPQKGRLRPRNECMGPAPLWSELPLGSL